MTVDKPWNQQHEPFSDESEWTTDNGTHISKGETVLAKPRFVAQRLPAVVERVYWEPEGLPGGSFDHRGEKVGEDDDGNVIYEHPERHDCILKVQFRFDVPEDHEYSHMDGKTHRTEAYNLDFVVGDAPEIRRDRSNCNIERE